MTRALISMRTGTSMLACVMISILALMGVGGSHAAETLRHHASSRSMRSSESSAALQPMMLSDASTSTLPAVHGGLHASTLFNAETSVVPRRSERTRRRSRQRQQSPSDSTHLAKHDRRGRKERSSLDAGAATRLDSQRRTSSVKPRQRIPVRNPRRAQRALMPPSLVPHPLAVTSHATVQFEEEEEEEQEGVEESYLVVGFPSLLSTVLRQTLMIYRLDNTEITFRLTDGNDHDDDGEDDAELQAGLDPAKLRGLTPQQRMQVTLTNTTAIDILFVPAHGFFKEPQEDIVQLPVFALASVPIYHFPGVASSHDSTGEHTLVLSIDVLTHIFVGEIQWWNDTQIVELNEGMEAAGFLPHEPIVVVMGDRADTEAWDVILHAMCKDVHGDVEIELGGCISDDSYAPDPSHYHQLILVSDTRAASAAVLTHPYSIGFSTQPEIIFSHLSAVSMQNDDGDTVVPSIASNFLALLERGQAVDEDLNNFIDLTLPKGPSAWPFSQYIYAQFRHANWRGTCADRAQLHELLEWLFESDVMQDVAAAQYVSLLPSVVVDSMDLENVISLASCEGEDIVLEFETEVEDVLMVGATQVNLLMGFLTSLLTNKDGVFAFLWQEDSREHAREQLLEGEASVAIEVSLQPDFTNGVEDAADRHLSIPIAAATVIPIFRLHDDVVASVRLLEEDEREELLPLVLDLDVLALLFTGQIANWTDTRLTRYNPGLRELYEHAADASITAILCCGDSDHPQSSLDLLYSALLPSAYFQSSALSTYPLNFSHVFYSSSESYDEHHDDEGISSSGVRFVWASTEAHLDILVDSHPGSIGFVALRQAAGGNDLNRFAMAPWQGRSLTDEELRADAVPVARVRASVQSMGACFAASGADELDFSDAESVRAAVPQVDLATAYLNIGGGVPQTCFPLTRLLNAVFLPSYSSASGIGCEQATHTVGSVLSMATLPLIRELFGDKGLFRVADEPSGSLAHQITTRMQQMACDGESMLVTTARLWKLSESVQIVLTTVASLGVLAALLMIPIVLYFRAMPVFRSSSVPFLVMILVGLIMLFLSVSFWSEQETTYDNCAAFNWLANLGFSLAFAPLFSKCYRIWRIFGRRALQVVKISNRQLSLLVFAIISFDIIVLSAWQASSVNFKRVTIYRQETKLVAYQHCAPRDGDAVYLALLGVSKCALLAFGAVMGLVTRNVTSQFNEAKQIAYGIYSTVFTLSLAMPILLLLDLLGDGLVAIVGFVVIVIALTILLCMFVPKLAELRAKYRENNVTSVGSSLPAAKPDSDSLAFSFPSLSLIPDEQLKQYLIVLRTQAKAAEHKLRQLGMVVPLATASAGMASGVPATTPATEDSINVHNNGVEMVRPSSRNDNQPARVQVTSVSGSLHPPRSPYAPRSPSVNGVTSPSGVDAGRLVARSHVSINRSHGGHDTGGDSDGGGRDSPSLSPQPTSGGPSRVRLHMQPSPHTGSVNRRNLSAQLPPRAVTPSQSPDPVAPEEGQVQLLSWTLPPSGVENAQAEHASGVHNSADSAVSALDATVSAGASDGSAQPPTGAIVVPGQTHIPTEP